MTKKIIRKDTDPSQGHCWPPGLPVEGSPDTYVNGQAVVRVTDNYSTHPGPCDLIPPHAMLHATTGSTAVFVNNLAVHRDGDQIFCGDAGDNGSEDTFAGDSTGSLAFTSLSPTLVETFGLPKYSVDGDEIGYVIHPTTITYAPEPYEMEYESIHDLDLGSDCQKEYQGEIIHFPPVLVADIVEELTGKVVGKFKGCPAPPYPPGYPCTNSPIPLQTQKGTWKIVGQAWSLKIHPDTGVITGTPKCQGDTDVPTWVIIKVECIDSMNRYATGEAKIHGYKEGGLGGVGFGDYWGPPKIGGPLGPVPPL